VVVVAGVIQIAGAKTDGFDTSVRSSLAAAAIREEASQSTERKSREDELRRPRSRLGKQVDRVFGLMIVIDSIHPTLLILGGSCLGLTGSASPLGAGQAHIWSLEPSTAPGPGYS
jgi:hypothetical protein